MEACGVLGRKWRAFFPLIRLKKNPQLFILEMSGLDVEGSGRVESCGVAGLKWRAIPTYQALKTTPHYICV